MVNPLLTRDRLLDDVPKYTSYVKLNPLGSLPLHDNVGVMDTSVCPLDGDGLDGLLGGTTVAVKFTSFLAPLTLMLDGLKV